MMAAGALEEVRVALPAWQTGAPWTRAIGAPELAAHLRGECSLPQAVAAAKTASRQYAKRQRTWFRSRMAAWRLLETQASLAEIGFLSGYSDQPHFTRDFRQLVGITPAQYRKDFGAA
jgi:tRNA A37 N6-isopentenylltransferase MiaA